MNTDSESLISGTPVIIEPSDADDPLAQEWAGRRCTVVIHAQSKFYNYVRVKDIGGHKATFRPKDVRRVA